MCCYYFFKDIFYSIFGIDWLSEGLEDNIFGANIAVTAGNYFWPYKLTRVDKRWYETVTRVAPYSEVFFCHVSTMAYVFSYTCSFIPFQN